MKSNRLIRSSLLLLGTSLSVPLPAQVSVASAPVGVLSTSIKREESGLAFPLLAREVLVATATGNTGGVLSFPADHANLGALLTASGRYYVEVLSGPFEGERLDVDTAATIAAGDAAVTLSFGSGTHSTLSTLAAGALAGARCALRPHMTLAALKSMFTPALKGDNTASKADGVQLYGPGGFDFFYLRGDGVTWRKAGGGTADLRNLVIPPDVGVLLELRSGGKRWTHTGRVRTNAFRKNLRAGLQAFATGFPVDLSPLDVGAFVDTSVPAAERWTGNESVGMADRFQVFFDTYSTPHALYYLRGDGTSWRSTTSTTNVAATPILGATAMQLVRRVNPDGGYVILPPIDVAP
ncbi:MAG TPA: hypothetical protein VGD81_00370 [Opitutaceae bacterium]